MSKLFSFTLLKQKLHCIFNASGKHYLEHKGLVVGMLYFILGLILSGRVHLKLKGGNNTLARAISDYCFVENHLHKTP